MGLVARDLEILRDGRTIVRGASLLVRPGEMVALVGASGSGKTTLLHGLAGLLRPARGSIVWCGTELLQLGARAHARFRREQVALLSQELDLLANLSSTENVVIPLLFAGYTASAGRIRAREALVELGLADHQDTPAHRLSRGQRQRVALARAFVHPGRILILDEPTTALDASIRDATIARIAARAEGGAAVLVATHDEQLRGASARVYAVRDGTLVEEP